MLARALGGLIVALAAGAPFQATADKVDEYVRQQMKQRGMPGPRPSSITSRTMSWR